LSKDPIGLEGGLNLYVFCGNDPVNFVDPWGEDTFVPDVHNHGGPHVDRYRGSTNVGRYRPNGSGIPHKGKMPPKLSKQILKGPFAKAAAKLPKIPMLIMMYMPPSIPQQPQILPYEEGKKAPFGYIPDYDNMKKDDAGNLVPSQWVRGV